MKLIGALAFIFSIAAAQTAIAEGLDQCDGASPDADAQPLVRIPGRLPDTPEANKDATVILCFDISPEGMPAENIRIVSSSDPFFEQPSIDAVKRWKYQPLILHGAVAWRRGVVTTINYFGEPGGDAKREAARLEKTQRNKSRIEKQRIENSWCRPSDKILEIKTSCICPVDIVRTFGRSWRRPEIRGFVGYISKAEMHRIGLEGFAENYMQPVRLTGACGDNHPCGVQFPVDGPVEACAIATNWRRFIRDEDSGPVEPSDKTAMPQIYLQELPMKEGE